jgi:hypothetical protein
MPPFMHFPVLENPIWSFPSAHQRWCNFRRGLLPICLTRSTLAAVRIPRARQRSAVSHPNRTYHFTPDCVSRPPGPPHAVESVHDCPLHCGSYVVTTHTASVRRLPAGSAESRQSAFHRFRLTLPRSASEPPTWEPISGGGTVDCVLIDSFTYSGYGLSFSCRRQVPRRICRPTTRPGENTAECTWIVPLPEEHPSSVSLSPDTGALTICSGHGADVYYYQ